MAETLGPNEPSAPRFRPVHQRPGGCGQCSSTNRRTAKWLFCLQRCRCLDVNTAFRGASEGAAVFDRDHDPFMFDEQGLDHHADDWERDEQHHRDDEGSMKRAKVRWGTGRPLGHVGQGQCRRPGVADKEARAGAANGPPQNVYCRKPAACAAVS